MMFKITNELIKAYSENSGYFARSIKAKENRIKALREKLQNEEAALAFSKDALRLSANCQFFDGKAVKVDGFWYESVAQDENGSTFRAKVYELQNALGFFAVTVNEVNHRLYHSPPFRWGGGKVVGIEAGWNEEQARQAALDWVVRNFLPPGSFY